MKRNDRIKLIFTRNWNFPGKERLARWLNPAEQLKQKLENGIVWFNEEEIAIYASADNYIEYTVLTTGTYENEISKLISISLNAGDNALDIGANIGIQSIRMSKKTGKAGKVYAFEPMAHLQQKFRQNMLLNNCRGVTLFSYALAEQDDDTTFEVDPNGWNQGTFSLAAGTSGKLVQNIKVRTGDGLREIQELQSLALIKIDVEGFEFQVISGLKNTISRLKPRIIFEYDSNYWIKTGQSIAACAEFLFGTGYELYQITTVGCELIKPNGVIESGNIFCIPKTDGE
jgi:FkbM family methyltransferase